MIVSPSDFSAHPDKCFGKNCLSFLDFTVLTSGLLEFLSPGRKDMYYFYFKFLFVFQLHETLDELEDVRRQLLTSKKKNQKLLAEMQDSKLHLEEQMSHNNDLERKQRR